MADARQESTWHGVPWSRNNLDDGQIGILSCVIYVSVHLKRHMSLICGTTPSIHRTHNIYTDYSYSMYIHRMIPAILVILLSCLQLFV